jgi:large subunit ribosomal protein L28
VVAGLRDRPPALHLRFAPAATLKPDPLGLPGAVWLYFAAVSRVCVICSKRPGTGNNRSHSMVATKRRFDVNLQKIRILMDGAPVRAYVCTRCLKSGRVQKAV